MSMINIIWLIIKSIKIALLVDEGICLHDQCSAEPSIQVNILLKFSSLFNQVNITSEVMAGIIT